MEDSSFSILIPVLASLLRKVTAFLPGLMDFFIVSKNKLTAGKLLFEREAQEILALA